MPRIFIGKPGRWLPGILLGLLLVGGCGRDPVAVQEDLDQACIERAAREAVALAGEHRAVWLPVVDPEEPGAPPIIPVAWEERIARECRRARVALVVTRFKGPGRFAESESPIDAPPFFDTLKGLANPPVVLLLFPVPEAWPSAELAAAAANGTRWVVVDDTGTARPPAELPGVRILPRNPPLNDAPTPFDRFYEVVPTAP